MSDPVVMALRAALAAQDGPALRVAIGRRLLDLSEPREALQELERALTFEPTNREALEHAARAAEIVGDSSRAAGYRTALAASTSWAAAGAAPAESSPTTTPSAATTAFSPNTTSPAAAPPDRRRATGPDEASTPPPVLRLVSVDDPVVEEARPEVTFEDVGGLDGVKQRLNRSFLLPLRQPEVFARFGKPLGGGLLLYGPPGCGKTFIARALAGEIGARFMSIGLSDVLDMWLGESERKLHEVFENARRQSPTLIFFDEVDALGQRRSQLKHSAGRNVVNQLLAEMDGFAANNRDVFVLGATNHPWDIDPALRRPGRFDRMVFVPSPDVAARERILALKLRDRPTSAALDLAALARKTEGFSGADLRALVDAATEMAFETTVASGREHVVDQALLSAALRDARPSTQPWLETARNYAVYANEGGVYDDLLAYLKGRGMG